MVGGLALATTIILEGVSVCVCEQRLVGLFFLLGSKDAEEKFPEKKSIEGTYSDLLAPSGGFRSD